MSDSQTRDDARQAAATEPSATETQTAPETSPETSTETASPPGTEQAAPDETKPPERTKEELAERALRRTFIEARETERKLRLVQEQLERLKPPRDPNAPPSQEDFDRAVEQRAAAMLDQREHATRSEAWIAKGNAEYPDFTERCNELAALGAGENPAFMAAIGKLADGHKVIADLAANPGETARILRLPAVDLAIEVANIGHRIASTPPPAPKPTTQAPPPIRPLQTSARAEVNLSNLDGAAFRSAFLKQFRG